MERKGAKSMADIVGSQFCTNESTDDTVDVCKLNLRPEAPPMLRLTGVGAFHGFGRVSVLRGHTVREAENFFVK